jgi:sensor domain CHASE-containing protein
MTLRQKTILITSLTLAGLLASLYAILVFLTQRSTAELEAAEAQRHAASVQAALDLRLADLRVKAADWATWDETYQFVAGENPSYIENNLDDTAIAQLQLNVMLFVNPSNAVVYGKAVDLQTVAEVPLPPALVELGKSGTALTRLASADSAPSGIVLLPEGPLLVAARPILRSDAQGPIRGTLVFGRYLDEAELAQLSTIAQFPLTTRTFNGDALPADFQTAQQALTGSTRLFTQPLDAATFGGYVRLDDFFGQPAVLLRVESPRHISEQAQSTLLNTALTLLIVGLSMGMIAWWVLDRQVLSRLLKLSNVINAIRRSGDLTQRVAATGKDEVAQLGNAFNGLVGQLQHTVANLEDREAERSRQLAAIAALSNVAARVTGVDPLLARAVEVVREHLVCEGVSIYLLDQAGEVVLRETTLTSGLVRGSRPPLGTDSAVGWVFAHQSARIIGDVRAEPQALVAEPIGDWRTVAAFPLRAGDHVLGALELRSARRHALSPADVNTIKILADQITIALENDRLLSRQKRVTEIEALTLTLTEKIHQSLKPEAILESAALDAGRALGARRAVVRLYSAETIAAQASNDDATKSNGQANGQPG